MIHQAQNHVCPQCQMLNHSHHPSRSYRTRSNRHTKCMMQRSHLCTKSIIRCADFCYFFIPSPFSWIFLCLIYVDCIQTTPHSICTVLYANRICTLRNSECNFKIATAIYAWECNVEKFAAICD